jgi:hypothetical protein
MRAHKKHTQPSSPPPLHARVRACMHAHRQDSTRFAAAASASSSVHIPVSRHACCSAQRACACASDTRLGRQTTAKQARARCCDREMRTKSAASASPHTPTSASRTRLVLFPITETRSRSTSCFLLCFQKEKTTWNLIFSYFTTHKNSFYSTAAVICCTVPLIFDASWTREKLSRGPLQLK